ncbi:MAG: protoheme IX farnesyltransferase [Rubellimicrobium sp.]|nr:protoheme IX farnesyltransferase [Rubellimicrobium sp.]
MTDASLEGETHEATFGDYVVLLKPRVMSLVVFTAFVGMIVAPGGLHPFEMVVAVLCIAVGAGASGALNMWWDADIDRLMRRTRNRPIPAGRVAPGEALALGVALSGFAVVMLWLTTNALAAVLLAVTIFYYAVVYTMWLKRATPQNIVIGGVAGSFPPMVGWAAATGTVSPESLLMFALIFMWTPPHFWALALFVKSDYGDAGIPMLTETHGRRSARNHILVYALLLVPVALALAFTPIGGPVYLVVAVLLNLWFVAACLRVWRRDEAQTEADRHAAERRAFRVSLYYLFLHFSALLVERLLAAWGLGGWQALGLGVGG